MPPQIPYAKECLSIASRAADENGFIPVRTLAQKIGARIESRPLLVEATIATDANAEDPNEPWVVLIDSERFAVSNIQIESESSSQPLSSRLRTTIAHELIHTLMFTVEKADPKLNRVQRTGEKQSEYVKRVERLTEKLTPLLLIPEKEVDSLAAKHDASFDDFLSSRKRCAVSRQIFISRLSLLTDSDFRRNFGGLKSKILGLVQRGTSGRWEVQQWPVFHNFPHDRLPWFISKILRRRAVEISEITNDPSFVLNGGTSYTIDLDGHLEGEKFDYMKMRIRLQIEPDWKGNEFPYLFFIQKL